MIDFAFIGVAAFLALSVFVHFCFWCNSRDASDGSKEGGSNCKSNPRWEGDRCKLTHTMKVTAGGIYETIKGITWGSWRLSWLAVPAWLAIWTIVSMNSDTTRSPLAYLREEMPNISFGSQEEPESNSLVQR